MKKILLSLLTIGIVSAGVFGATKAFFTDTETSTGNTFSAGIIDIAVDGQNPWTATYSGQLADMKPSEVRYIGFTVKNLENSNPVKLWKQIKITDQNDGTVTEPECEEGKGTWDGKECDGGYVERNNLAAYTIYDLYVCEVEASGNTCGQDDNGKPTGGGWKPIIVEDQYVRLDNVDGAWIYLGQLDKGKELKVVQSYHLRSWPGAPEPEVGNWAQGDVMKFDIELMATQLNAPGPTNTQAFLKLENKDPTTWAPIAGDDIEGTLSYNTAGPTFNYSFTGKVPLADTGYCLIYYADPWPGYGKNGLTGMAIGCSASGSDGDLSLSGNPDLGIDLPHPDDQNYPGGAKIQVVLEADYDKTNHKMIRWNPSNYLFEMNFITYDYTP